MTVTDVLLNFRSALEALVPRSERVRIPWRRGDAYDEWDGMASALYDGLVVHTLRSSLPESLWANFRMPAYDLLLPAYAGLSTVEVAPAEARTIFHAFSTIQRPFDVVEVLRVSPNGRPSSSLETLPLEHAEFVLRLPPTLGGRVVTTVV